MKSLLAFVRLALKQPLNQIILFIVVLLIVLGGLMNYLLGRPARNKVLGVGLELQLASARSGAAAVETFIDTVGRSIETMALRPGVTAMNTETRAELEQLLAHWEGTSFVGMGIVDEKGKMVMVVNSENVRTGEGDDFSDREYFRLAMASEGKYVIGDTIISKAGATVGKNIVPIAVPIIVDGQKKGVLVAGIWLSKLADDFFERVLLSPKTNTFLIRNDGLIEYGDQEMLIGSNIYDQLKKNQILPLATEYIADQARQILSSGKEGTLRLTLPAMEGAGLENYLLSYVPVDWKGRELCGCVMVVMTPEKEILGAVGPLYVRQILVIVVVFIALMAFAIRVAKVVGYNEGL